MQNTTCLMKMKPTVLRKTKSRQENLLQIFKDIREDEEKEDCKDKILKVLGKRCISISIFTLNCLPNTSWFLLALNPDRNILKNN